MQTEDYSYNIELLIETSYDSSTADLVEASTYNQLLSIDDSVRYHDFTISQGK